MMTVVANAFIQSKYWQVQTNPKHNIKDRIRNQAKTQVRYKQVFRGQDYDQEMSQQMRVKTRMSKHEIKVWYVKCMNSAV